MMSENKNNNISHLKIDIYYIIKYLFSDSLTEDDKNQLEEYISKLNLEQLKIFKRIGEELDHNAKYYGVKKYKITSNSIKLAIKIFNDIEIATFPCIEKIATKGWSISDGTFAWGMFQLDSFPAPQIYSGL